MKGKRSMHTLPTIIVFCLERWGFHLFCCGYLSFWFFILFFFIGGLYQKLVYIDFTHTYDVMLYQFVLLLIL